MLPESGFADIVPVILAGGEGVRLRPLSTPSRPKPFLRLPGQGGRSLLQQAAARAAGMAPPVVIANARHREWLAAQVPDAQQFILEPCGRGTAPAVAAAAHYLGRRRDVIFLVMPSDHAIKEPDIFRDAVAAALKLVRQGMLVTFGVRPRSASPHYGYIRAGQALDTRSFAISAFTEKPSRAAAQDYLRQGGYLWNSGIFLFSATAYLAALKAQQPAIHEAALAAVSRATRLQNAIFLNPESFSACPSLSIDYAVMEKTPHGAVVPVAMKWRDLGTWPSLLAAMIGK